MLLRRRAQLAADGRTLQRQALASLATPRALLGGFCLGFALALLTGRRRSRPAGKAAPAWLRLLLRELAAPVAMGAVQTYLTTQQMRTSHAWDEADRLPPTGNQLLVF